MDRFNLYIGLEHFELKNIIIMTTIFLYISLENSILRTS